MTGRNKYSQALVSAVLKRRKKREEERNSAGSYSGFATSGGTAGSSEIETATPRADEGRRRQFAEARQRAAENAEHGEAAGQSANDEGVRYTKAMPEMGKGKSVWQMEEKPGYMPKSEESLTGMTKMSYGREKPDIFSGKRNEEADRQNTQASQNSSISEDDRVLNGDSTAADNDRRVAVNRVAEELDRPDNEYDEQRVQERARAAGLGTFYSPKVLREARKQFGMDPNNLMLAVSMFVHSGVSNGEEMPDKLKVVLGAKTIEDEGFKVAIDRAVTKFGADKDHFETDTTELFNEDELGLTENEDQFRLIGTDLQYAIGKIDYNIKGDRTDDGRWLISFDVYTSDTIKQNYDFELEEEKEEKETKDPKDLQETKDPKEKETIIENFKSNVKGAIFNYGVFLQGIGIVKPYPIRYGGSFLYRG